ncbi:diguanylate cyclase domain-containing protein [Lyngbya sp. PCC 8106]|uniref:diguanylate cyclase domain-containing protein n=1 Tax=Lyngbya sp. (strain PCC 8106) TaxID=313612 RepID=UPI0018DE3FD5|nr:diguanylate cyclase [Lyngbya sp. PCC 8106]
MNWSISSIVTIWVGGVGLLALVSFWLNFSLFSSEFLQTSLSLHLPILFSFVLFSLVLKLLQNRQQRQGFKSITQLCSVLIIAIGFFTLSEEVRNWNFYFEPGLIQDHPSLFILRVFLPLFEQSSFVLIFLAIVLLLLIHKTPSRIKVAQIITSLVLAIETTNLITFFLDIPCLDFGIVFSNRGIPLKTISFIILCLGLLWIYPHRGLMRTFTHRSVFGIRPYSLFIGIIFLVLFDRIVLDLPQNLQQEQAFLLGLKTVLEISVILGLVYWTNNRFSAVNIRFKRSKKQLKYTRQTLQTLHQTVEDQVIECRDYQQMIAALQQQEQDFRVLVENSPDIISRVDRQYRFCYVNPQVERETGIQASDWIGKTELELGFSEDIVLPWHQVIQQVFETGKEHLYETKFPTSDGIFKYWQCRIVPEFNAQGMVESVLTASREITEEKIAEEALNQCVQHEKLLGEINDRIRQSLELDQILATAVTEVQQILQVDRVLIYRFNPDWSGTIITESVVAGFNSILNKSCQDSYLVQTQGEAFSQGNIQVMNDIYTANLTPCHQELLIQLQIRASLLLPILIFPTPTQSEVVQQNVWGLLGIHSCVEPRHWQTHDIEFLKRLTGKLAIAIQQSALYEKLQNVNQELSYMAHYDQLTQIANRRYFDEYFEQEWSRIRREQVALSLILCDVDYFKHYNDTYGHLAGDQCLVQVAEAISRGVKRPADLVARYGGEEFVVILPNTNMEGAIEVVHCIQNEILALNLPHSTSLTTKQITLSFGIACVYPASRSSRYDLINQADKALYQAKDAGRNGYAIIEIES